MLMLLGVAKIHVHLRLEALLGSVLTLEVRVLRGCPVHYVVMHLLRVLLSSIV
jgi:hypothetical protein